MAVSDLQDNSLFLPSVSRISFFFFFFPFCEGTMDNTEGHSWELHHLELLWFLTVTWHFNVVKVYQVTYFEKCVIRPLSSPFPCAYLALSLVPWHSLRWLTEPFGSGNFFFFLGFHLALSWAVLIKRKIPTPHLFSTWKTGCMNTTDVNRKEQDI